MQTPTAFPEVKDDDAHLKGVEVCDCCWIGLAKGTMFYALQRSKGGYVPVLFVCDACEEESSDASAPHP